MTNSPGFSRFRRLFLAAALLLVCQPAFADKRVALVIGNSAYQNVARLPNPVNDGATIAATLKDAGFDVVDSRHDLPAAETRRVLRDFADSARDADIAVVYYAGHGIEVDGGNYLIPVDAKLERDTDVYDEALSLDRVLLAIEPAKRLRLVILDACRDNPYARSFRSPVRGLASIDAPSGTLIAYATAPGRVARDGTGANGLYTGELLRAMGVPGLRIEDVFKRVRQSVQQQTGGEQVPWESSSLVGDFVFAPQAVAAARAIAPTLAGSWRGDMIQPNSRKGSYPMILTITELADGGYRGAVDYPSLGCSGWLTIVEQRDRVYRFQERLERGPHDCGNGGIVEMRLTGHGSIQLDWYFPEGRLGATSVLRRTD